MIRRYSRVVPVAMIGALVGAWLTVVTAEAQRAAPARIGALTESWGPTTLLVGLRDGLQELGYREDRDFSIGVRFTQGDPAELPAAARDLVRLGVDLIVAADTTNAVKAARMATDRIPIVFVGGSDPVGEGLVKSFARPGGNITGVADIDIELVPKRMELSARSFRAFAVSCSPTTRRTRSPPLSSPPIATRRGASASPSWSGPCGPRTRRRPDCSGSGRAKGRGSFLRVCIR
jgi:putative ABC transport system substrate-binding protein